MFQGAAAGAQLQAETSILAANETNFYFYLYIFFASQMKKTKQNNKNQELFLNEFNLIYYALLLYIYIYIFKVTNFHFYFCLNLIIHNLKILLLLLILISNKQSFKNKWISQWILLIGGGVVSLISESQDCLFNRSHKLKCDITAKFFVSPSKNHLVLLARFINKKKKAKRKQKNEYFKILCSGVSHGESLLVVRVICPLPHVHAESAGPLCACHHQYWNSPGAPLRRHGLPQAQQSVKGARIMRGPQWNWVTPINLFTPSTLTTFNTYIFLFQAVSRLWQIKAINEYATTTTMDNALNIKWVSQLSDLILKIS